MIKHIKIFIILLVSCNISSANMPGTYQPLLLKSTNPTTITYNANSTDTVDRSTYTFAGISFGTTTNRNCVAVVFGTRANSARTVTSVTIGGVSATLVETANQTTGGADISSMYVASGVSGTTGDIVITMSNTMLRMVVASYSIYNTFSCTPYNSNDNIGTTGGTLATTVNIPANGAVLGAIWLSGSTSMSSSWTGANEDFDTQPETSSNAFSGSHQNLTNAETARSISVAITGTVAASSLVTASWGP